MRIENSNAAWVLLALHAFIEHEYSLLWGQERAARPGGLALRKPALRLGRCRCPVCESDSGEALFLNALVHTP